MPFTNGSFIIIYELPVSGNHRYLGSLCITCNIEKYRGQGMTRSLRVCVCGGGGGGEGGHLPLLPTPGSGPDCVISWVLSFIFLHATHDFAQTKYMVIIRSSSETLFFKLLSWVLDTPHDTPWGEFLSNYFYVSRGIAFLQGSMCAQRRLRSAPAYT